MKNYASKQVHLVFSMLCIGVLSWIIYTSCQQYEPYEVTPSQSTSQSSQSQTSTIADLPMPVTDIQIIGLDSGVVVLSWDNPVDDEHFSYVSIVRNMDSAPEDITDGDLIYSGRAEQFQDLDIEATQVYYYHIYACNEWDVCETVGISGSIQQTGYTLGGTITDLSGSLVLSDGSGALVLIDQAASFTFPGIYTLGSAYHVSILEQPENQRCQVLDGSGTFSSDVSNVSISCQDTFAVSGTVHDLDFGQDLTLQLGYTDTLSISSNGAFSFTERKPTGSWYEVTVRTQPFRQQCYVTNGEGLIEDADITNVTIDCVSSGTGSEGVLSVSSDVVVNDVVTTGVGDITAGTSSFEVVDSTGFYTNDNVLIIQQRGAGTGNWEEHSITISGTTLTLDEPVQFTYSLSGANDVFAIYRIPQYESLLISPGGRLIADEWDGTSGGILAFTCKKSIEFQGGSIDASGMGYRGGGCGSCNSETWGYNGEGILSPPDVVPSVDTGTTVNETGNNGGAGAHQEDGIGGNPGGGGGYAEVGGVGTSTEWNAQGGDPVGSVELAQFYFGGGGGGPGDHDNCSPAESRKGGNGGGIIYIVAGKIINADIHADGADAVLAGSCSGQGVGGSGAGGSIYLKAHTVKSSSITAIGGAAVDDGDDDIGGAGSVGRIRIDATSYLGADSNPAAYNG